MSQHTVRTGHSYDCKHQKSSQCHIARQAPQIFTISLLYSISAIATYLILAFWRGECQWVSKHAIHPRKSSKAAYLCCLLRFPMTDILFADRSAQGLGHIYRAGCEKQVFFQNQVVLQRLRNPWSPCRFAHDASPREKRVGTSRGHKSSSKAQPKRGCCHVVRKLDACGKNINFLILPMGEDQACLRCRL